MDLIEVGDELPGDPRCCFLHTRYRRFGQIEFSKGMRELGTWTVEHNN